MATNATNGDPIFRDDVKAIINAKNELIEKIMALYPGTEKIEINFNQDGHYSIGLYFGDGAITMPDAVIRKEYGGPIEVKEHTVGTKYETEMIED